MLARALIEYDPKAKAYSATCPELNFISSCGETKEDAMKNLQEAIVLMFEPIPEAFLHNCLDGGNEKYETLEFMI